MRFLFRVSLSFFLLSIKDIVLLEFLNFGKCKEMMKKTQTCWNQSILLQFFFNLFLVRCLLFLLQFDVVHHVAMKHLCCLVVIIIVEFSRKDLFFLFLKLAFVVVSCHVVKSKFFPPLPFNFFLSFFISFHSLELSSSLVSLWFALDFKDSDDLFMPLSLL